MVEEMFAQVSGWYMQHINYGTLTLLMAVESSFIPFPSEIIVPPAAWKAAQGEMHIVLVVLFATLGALIGAAINYYLAFFLGRRILYAIADTRIAHALLIDRAHVEKSELFFIKYGRSSTFIGRLVPAVRQLISLPAGLARMNLRTFFLFTTLGAVIWNIILALLGFFLYSQKEVLHRYYTELSWIFLGLGALFVSYIASRFIFVRKKKQPVSS